MRQMPHTRWRLRLLRKEIAMSESFDEIAGELAKNFARLPSPQFGDYWETALMHMVMALGFDRGTLWKFDQRGVLSSSCWARDNIPHTLGLYLNERLPYVYSLLDDPNDIKVIDVLGLPATATVDNRFIHLNGMRYMVCVPLVANQKIIGRLTMGSFDPGKKIDQRLFKPVKLFSALFATALHKEKLEIMLSSLNGGDADLAPAAAPPLVRPFRRSGRINAVLERARQVADTDTTVLIQGETGTGKELLARFIHNAGKRAANAMHAVNCATFSQELMESQLFGHEKGAFTGAVSRRLGLFEVASESTLFFDEIAEMPAGAQAKMLRVLQEKQFERLGSCRPIRTNARIIAATNKDLLEEVRRGAFREDLYYRINVFTIRLPPLRERREEIEPLVYGFIREFNAAMGKQVDHVSPGDMAALTRHHWPGNIRELRNVVEGAMILSRGARLALDLSILKSPPLLKTPPQKPQLASLEEMERQHIIAALNKTQWRVSGKGGAAELLQINAKTLDSRMRKLGITRK